MRPQILAAALAVLLVALFLAAWGFTLPGAPAVPFTPGARAAPTATPPPSAAPTPIASRPRPTPAPTPAPAPAPTPTLTPMPTPTLRPTPTPAPTSPPTPQPTLTPTPAPEAFFLEVHSPDNYAEVSGKPEVRVSASTLPWLISEIRYHSGSGLEQYRIVRADGNGNFSDQVPLAEGFNAIEIITYHGASEQKKRRSLAVIYDPEPVAPAPIALFLNISEPKDGATVSNRVLTVAGATAPDAEVVLNGIIPAAPDELGEWQASIVLRPGENEIRARAARGKESVADAITVTYDPGS